MEKKSPCLTVKATQAKVQMTNMASISAVGVMLRLKDLKYDAATHLESCFAMAPTTLQ